MVTVASKDSVMKSMVLSAAAVVAWPAAMLKAGRRVIAPMRQTAPTGGEAVEYRELSAGAPDATGLNCGIPRTSPKGAWFPRSEPVLRIHREGRSVTLSDPPADFPSLVLFGVRPCDAAAPRILAPLFGWDYHDPFFEGRMKNIAIVVMGCGAKIDDACFCTSVGVDPAGTGCGDVLLTELADGRFLAEARTDRGVELLALVEGDLTTVDVSAQRLAARSDVPVRFDPAAVRSALSRRFDDPVWEKFSRSCLACGTCAFVCPTCHCFDIQDEMTGHDGVRQKNWDACAFPLFTMHTSGHNPRHDQAGRWRQRLNHKFRYYPEKFDQILCTGCGRCLRLCPGGMDMLSDLEELSKDAPADIPALEPMTLLPGAVPELPAGTNIYKPYLMRIAAVRDETPDVRTLRLEFADPAEGQTFDFRVGQFGLYSPLGEGESTFCIASSSTRKGYIECTFRQAGRVTRALRRLGVGDLMGFRGPYGNHFPTDQWKGKDLLFVAGGIALPPMRSVIQYCLDNRQDFGDITIIYGARTWSDHVYKDELSEWEKRSDLNLWLCIDWKPAADGKGLAEAEADAGWRPLNLRDPSASVLDPAHRRYTGFVPHLVEAVKCPPANRIAVLCGPPIMIKFTLASLKKLGYQSENVYTTLENRMKCGVGKCGRCNVGPVYICKEGPVFTAAQVEQMPAGEM